MSQSKRARKTVGKSIKTTQKAKDPTEDCLPIWTFTDIDKSGKFAFDICRKDFDLKLVFSKMIDFSNMKWSDIRKHTHDWSNKSKHHFLEYDSLSKDAKDRIEVKQLNDDLDSIFSFALNNKIRIIGIRRGVMFCVIWYDPEHEFCPSAKK